MSTRDDEFSEYVHGAYPRLVRTAYLLCGNAAQAEDLVQDALARTYLAWPRIRDKGALDAYVHRAVVNQTKSWWRRAARRERFVDPPERLTPDAGESGVLARSALLPALRALPPGQRAAVVLRYVEDLTEAQTALALGISVGTVKSQTSRALAALRLSLGDEATSTHIRSAGTRSPGAVDQGGER